MLKSVLPLSFIAASRFFGLFIVLPVLSFYAINLEGANQNLVGFVIGAYALSQMIFQIPFGIISDRFGRKLTMSIGLLIFIVGSIVCAVADNIYVMLLGRAIQGIGAVGGVASAMIADFTSENNRSKAMAILGGMIGISFLASMILSPIISAKWGLGSLFYISAFLSVICIVLLYTVVPPEIKSTKPHKSKNSLILILKDKDLAIMNITSLIQKMLMSIIFLIVPLLALQKYGWDKNNLWQIYAFASVFSFIAMGIAGALGDGKGFSKVILIIGVFLFFVSFIVFAYFSNDITGFVVGVIIFFVGFNMHEPIMQSTASKLCRASYKGAALSIFGSFGFFGSFLGGALGGIIMHIFGLYYLLAFCIFICLVWIFLLIKLKNPSEYQSIHVNISESQVQSIRQINGIFDVYNFLGEVVIKFDTKKINKDNVLKIINDLK